MPEGFSAMGATPALLHRYFSFWQISLCGDINTGVMFLLQFQPQPCSEESGHHFLPMGSLVTDRRENKKKTTHTSKIQSFESLLKDSLLQIKTYCRPQVSV